MQNVLTTTLTADELVGIIEGAVQRALDGETGKKTVSPPITRKELIERLAISETTIIKLERQGIIPVIRMGGVMRYDYAEVLEALKENKRRKKTAAS